MTTNNYVRYSEAFKRQVVDEIDSGKFNGASSASEAYQIKGGAHGL